MQYKQYNYKFSEEDFNKLSQLDRIEYRQREAITKERYNINVSQNFLWTAVGVLAFVMILAVAGYGSLGKEFSLTMFLIMRNFGIAALIIYFICLIIEGVVYSIGTRELKKLKDSYFKIEVKKK